MKQTIGERYGGEVRPGTIIKEFQHRAENELNARVMMANVGSEAGIKLLSRN
jgi:hypothetical protein